MGWLTPASRAMSRCVSRLEPLGDDRYRAIGDLTLRGKTREVVGEMRLKIEGGVARAEGRATFDRKAYGVGVGFTTLFVDVDPEVTVIFDLTATRAE
ncbi:MAG: YceI family protein [Pseudomonadota bacterium]